MQPPLGMPKDKLRFVSELGETLRRKNHVSESDVQRLAPLVKSSSSLNLDMLLPNMKDLPFEGGLGESCRSRCESASSAGSASDPCGNISDMSLGTTTADDSCEIDYDEPDNDNDDYEKYYLPFNALQQAAYHGHSNAIIPLLANDANPDLKVEALGYEFSDLRPIEIAEQRGHYDVVQKFHEFFQEKKSIENQEKKSIRNQKTGWAARVADYDSDAGTDTSLMPPSPMTSAASSRAHSRCGSPVQQDDDKKPSGLMAIDGGNPISDLLGSSLSMLSPTGNSFTQARYGIATEDGAKKPSEDRMVADASLSDAEIFCVFDGHGGKYIADYLSKKLPELIKQKIRNHVGNSTDASSLSAEECASILKESFLEIDEEIVLGSERNYTLKQGGSTAVVAVVLAEHIVVAHSGDSRCIAFNSDGQVIKETRDHTAEDASERSRIEKLGAAVEVGVHDNQLKVKSPRGQISVTRALGQVQFKFGVPRDKRIITAEPQVCIWSRYEMELSTSLKGENNRHVLDTSLVPSQTVIEDGTPNTVAMSLTSEISAAGAGAGHLEQARQNLAHKRKRIIDKYDGVSSTSPKKSRAGIPRVMLALFSDSFTEAVADNHHGEVDAAGRPRQIIENIVSNDAIARVFTNVVVEMRGDLPAAAEAIALRQANKFRFDGKYHGDNTTVILVDIAGEQL